MQTAIWEVTGSWEKSAAASPGILKPGETGGTGLAWRGERRRDGLRGKAVEDWMWLCFFGPSETESSFEARTLKMFWKQW